MLRQWEFFLEGLEWRWVGGFGLVYHRGKGTTHTLPRQSLEVLASLRQRAGVVSEEELLAAADSIGALSQAEPRAAGGAGDALERLLEPLRAAGLIWEIK